MNRLDATFQRLKGKGEQALIAYIMAGDPSLQDTEQLVLGLERSGADVIELGVPFSDPIADGPVIQRASERALKHNTSLCRVLQIAAEIRTTSQIPLLLFTYMNPVMRYGIERLARDARAFIQERHDPSIERIDPPPEPTQLSGLGWLSRSISHRRLPRPNPTGGRSTRARGDSRASPARRSTRPRRPIGS